MESGITRERVIGGGWGCWKEKRKCFHKNTGSAESEVGQGSGTLSEVFWGGHRLGFGPLQAESPSQWIVPVMVAWALLEEDNHSSPGRGRSLQSDN